MTDQQSKSRVIRCPKCQSSTTARTGAYNIDTQPSSSRPRDETQVTIIYDRRCGECGHIFTEVVESDDVA